MSKALLSSRWCIACSDIPQHDGSGICVSIFLDILEPQLVFFDGLCQYSNSLAVQVLP